MENQSIVSFAHCGVGRPEAPVLADFSWELHRGEHWIITGPNGGGKSAAAAALWGTLPVSGDFTNYTDGEVGLVSFERQRDIIFRERYLDDSDFVEGGVDPGTTARAFIMGAPGHRYAKSAARTGVDAGSEAIDAGKIEEVSEIARGLGISAILERGIKFLSTGEIRKVILCREFAFPARILVLDEIFEGLDIASREFVAGKLEEIMKAGRTQLVLISDRYEHVLQSFTHVLRLEKRVVSFRGTRTDYEAMIHPTLPAASGLSATVGSSVDSSVAEPAGFLVVEPGKQVHPHESGRVLVEMRSVSVRYGERLVLDGLNFSVHEGQHTLIRGPNGCGKTTLLNLITGDNPQVYANEITVCGIRRGQGESIWDVKTHLGMVSYQLHLEYQYHCDSTLEETVQSGFYDSIGMYREAGYREESETLRWLDILGLAERAREPFMSLSYGEQRLVLVARAAIKKPDLLILDEPCHGLDPEYRDTILSMADRIGTLSSSTIIYVTHDPAEQLSCTRQILDFERQGDQSYRPVLTEMASSRQV